MQMPLHSWLKRLLASCLCLLSIAAAAAGPANGASPLVDAAWLQEHRANVVLLDASMTAQHRAGHIPGAVSADLYRYGVDFPTPEAMERRLRSWGIDAGSKVVVYDQGADMMATRLFFDLYHFGLPVDSVFILDGGLAKWRESGGPVTDQPTPPPTPGAYRVTEVREQSRVRLPEFLLASGDRANHVLVDALEPDYYYGGRKFFDRAGHVPNAVLMGSAEFFNADKTFKAPEEIRRMARYMGIKPGQVVHSHCGGGVAASVPWFALQFLGGHPKARLYVESQREWLRDERQLPYWTYGAPQLQRNAAWLDGWNTPMTRFFGVAQLNLVDVRPADQYAAGHVPFALNITSETFRRHLRSPGELAALLGPAGVNPQHEIVVMAERGLTADAALAFLAFEQLGHQKVSVLFDPVDDWALRGLELTKTPTRIGRPSSMQDFAVPPASYPRMAQRSTVLTGDPAASAGEYAKVFVASGTAAPTRAPAGKLVHLPHTQLVSANGNPRSAAELYKLISKAGIPRHAEVVLFADDPADAAIGYFVFRLMGWPDVKVWIDG